MEGNEPFRVMDCSLVRLATGRECANLRELLEAIKTVPEPVLEHHMMRCVLEDPFELYEFPNDLAQWCWTALGDNVVAEELGLIDPYRQFALAPLREALVNAIESRLWGVDRVRWCRPGLELHLMYSRLIAYDIGEPIATPGALLDAIERMSPRSLFYHVHEARRRTQGRSDDFSLWLEQGGVDPALVASLREIDFYFLNLTQLREALIEAFRRHMAAAPPVARSAP